MPHKRAIHRLAFISKEELQSLTEVVNCTLACLSEDDHASTYLVRLSKLLNKACKRKGIITQDLLANVVVPETQEPKAGGT